VVVLDRPQATLSEPFSYVRGARELSNGALLAVDWIENRLVLADFATDRSRDVMREGRGPRELRLPSGLVRLRGDTTLLWDDGNNRAHILAPDGRSLRTIPTEAPGRGGIRGMDASGGYLHVVPSWAEGPNALPDDSVRIVRWDGTRTGEARVVAVVQGTRYRKDRSPALKPRLPMVGFAAQDAWVVAIDGSLVIVRANPYHVEVHPPNGPVVQGPAVPYDRRVVSAEDRRRFIREFAARSPVSGRGPDGSLGRGEAIDEAEVERMAGTAEWAEQFPPFDLGGPGADPGRGATVRRLRPAWPNRAAGLAAARPARGRGRRPRCLCGGRGCGRHPDDRAVSAAVAVTQSTSNTTSDSILRLAPLLGVG
jgi:hypothetical protein